MKEELELFQSITNHLLKEEEENPVTEYVDVETLKNKLDLTLEEEPVSEDHFKKILEELVLSTPKTATSAFFNQLFGGRKEKAVLGDLLAVMLNNSMYTYKVGGPQIIVEQEIIQNIAKKIGFGNNSGGTFAPGGSMSNMMAMIMARDEFDPTIRNDGVQRRMIAYTSKESHYSIPKNAAFTGIGRNNVRYIESDENGAIRTDKLEEAIKKDIEEGYAPFMVNATAGTTVLAAYDPLDKIADICEEYNLWMHTDGAYGGAVLFSEKHKHLLRGVERSDSFSINAHKMLGTPLSSSIIITKNKQNLYTSFSNKASYLYQTGEDDYNPGKTSLQCGRRNDALKFWCLWKAEGSKGLAAIVDKEFELAEYARNYVRNHSDYEYYDFSNAISVCFNYKSLDPDHLCKMLYEHAELMVGYGIFKEEKFVRLVFVNSNNSKEEVDAFFEKLEKFVAENENFFPEIDAAKASA